MCCPPETYERMQAAKNRTKQTAAQRFNQDFARNMDSIRQFADVTVKGGEGTGTLGDFNEVMRSKG